MRTWKARRARAGEGCGDGERGFLKGQVGAEKEAEGA